jgi:Flp pilus assembly protein TadB
MTGIVLAGSLVGIGLFLLVLAFQQPQTRGSSAPVALARMDLERHRQREAATASRLVGRGTGALGADGNAGTGSRLDQAGLMIRRQLDAAGIRLPAGLRADLSLNGRSIETHLALSVLGGLLGGGLLLFLSSLLVSVIPGLPVTTPLLVALIGLIVGALLPTVQAASAASVRRRDFRHVVGSFLDLVALNLSGGRGVPEALNSAASVSDGWAMVRLRDCLQVARLQGVTPWMALGALGEETGVAELRDLSAALELVADDGAKVRESLSARAASLRRRELADAEGRAQARSQSMLVAQVLLAVGFLIFLIYPAITRVLSS